MKVQTSAFLLLPIVAVATLAPSSPASAQDGSIKIPMKVCNHTEKDALVASIYLPVRRSSNRWWTGEGWFKIESGTCGIVGVSGSAIFYLRGESTDGRVYWADNGETHCIVRPGPYTITINGDSEYCPSGAETADFTKLEATINDTFTWNLY